MKSTIASRAGKLDESVSKKVPTRVVWVLVLATLLVLAVLALNWLHGVRHVARGASCANDLKTLGLALRTFANDNENLLPPMSNVRGNIMMDPAGLYPEIMESSVWVQCEYSDVRNRHGQPNKTDLGVRAFNADTFFYLPWELSNETEGLAFIEAYKTLDLHRREEDLSVTVDREPRILPRTRATGGLTSSRSPVMVEWPHQRHADMCVLYSDGSVHRMKMGEGFPMTEAFISGIREIANLNGAPRTN